MFVAVVAVVVFERKLWCKGWTSGAIGICPGPINILSIDGAYRTAIHKL